VANVRFRRESETERIGYAVLTNLNTGLLQRPWLMMYLAAIKLFAIHRVHAIAFGKEFIQAAPARPLGLALWSIDRFKFCGATDCGWAM
jgi:hypothetical protein